MRPASSRTNGAKARRKKAPAAPMKGSITTIDGDGKKTELGEFELESAPIKGEIPEAVVDELVHAKSEAKDYAAAFSDACKAMAKKYGVKVGALKKYVSARVSDKVEDARAEADDLVKLIG